MLKSGTLLCLLFILNKKNINLNVKVFVYFLLRFYETGIKQKRHDEHLSVT